MVLTYFVENCKHAVPACGISFDNWRFDSNNLHSSARYIILFLLSEQRVLDAFLFFPQFSIFLVYFLAGRNTQHYVSSVLCAGITAGVMAIVKANGRHLSSRPRLCGLL